MAGFTKLFSGLVHSTVWREDMHVKVVWITMLALADRNGHVLASMPGLADAARVSLEQCEEALQRLSAPDRHSRTKTHEGRRIQEIDGGWELFNYTKYRNIRDDENRRQQVREAVARHRAKADAEVITGNQGNPSKPGKAQAEAEAEAEREKDLSPSPPINTHKAKAIAQANGQMPDAEPAVEARAGQWLEAYPAKHYDALGVPFTVVQRRDWPKAVILAEAMPNDRELDAVTELALRAHGGDWDNAERTPGFIVSKLSTLRRRVKVGGVA